jgi:hypothetical protein
MRLSSRSYPHPVLGNRDDVPGAAFQTTIEMSADKEFVYLTVAVACSCYALNSLLASRRATLVLHVECSNTLFREAHELREFEHRIFIPADHLHDTVEVNVFACATDRIPQYRIPEAHPDYGDIAFGIERGDILAVGEGQVFLVESEFDALGRIGSIMQLCECDEDGDAPIQPDFSQDKIVVFLSKSDFANYKRLKHHASVRGPLTTTIVLPVLMEALRIAAGEEGDGLQDSRRWVRALVKRVEALNLSLQTSPLILAQQLLELPVKRAVASSLALVEASG